MPKKNKGAASEKKTEKPTSSSSSSSSSSSAAAEAAKDDKKDVKVSKHADRVHAGKNFLKEPLTAEGLSHKLVGARGEDVRKKIVAALGEIDTSTREGVNAYNSAPSTDSVVALDHLLTESNVNENSVLHLRTTKKSRAVSELMLGEFGRSTVNTMYSKDRSTNHLSHTGEDLTDRKNVICSLGVPAVFSQHREKGEGKDAKSVVVGHSATIDADLHALQKFDKLCGVSNQGVQNVLRRLHNLTSNGASYLVWMIEPLRAQRPRLVNSEEKGPKLSGVLHPVSWLATKLESEFPDMDGEKKPSGELKAKYAEYRRNLIDFAVDWTAGPAKLSWTILRKKGLRHEFDIVFTGRNIIGPDRFKFSAMKSFKNGPSKSEPDWKKLYVDTHYLVKPAWFFPEGEFVQNPKPKKQPPSQKKKKDAQKKGKKGGGGVNTIHGAFEAIGRGVAAVMAGAVRDGNAGRGRKTKGRGGGRGRGRGRGRGK